MSRSPHPVNPVDETLPSPPEPHHWEADLKLIVEGIASQIGENFFRACVRYLAELLQIKYAFIAEFVAGDEPKAKVLAFWAGEEFGPNFEYPLAGTPCGLVLDKGLQIYDRAIQAKFPDDEDLVTLGAESYLGIAICDSHGRTIGHIAGLDVQPLRQNYDEQEAILRIFAARSAAEIERQITDQELKQQNQRLEEALTELKHTQAQLIQAEKMSSLGHMVAGISHEINNPISFIYGNLTHLDQYYGDLLRVIQKYQQEHPNPSEALQADLDLIEVEFIKSDVKKILTSMKTGSQRISEIIRSFRSFSRLDESTFKVVDIHDGLESALTILQSRINPGDPQKRVRIVKSYGQIPPIHCAPSHLNQVFLDLLKNALDALEETQEPTDVQTSHLSQNTPSQNTIWIRTFISQEPETQGRLSIVIADNGPGITDEIREKIFDPFFTTKPIGKGTGLGLSVSYQTVTELHQGTLSCQSTVGQGTEFVVTLPI